MKIAQYAYINWYFFKYSIQTKVIPDEELVSEQSGGPESILEHQLQAVDQALLSTQQVCQIPSLKIKNDKIHRSVLSIFYFFLQMHIQISFIAFGIL